MVYQTSSSVRDLKSRGHSTAFNPRNLEHDWYPVWNEVFIDIKSLLFNVYIYPQYLLWLRDSEDLPLALREQMLEHLNPDEHGVTRDLDDADRALLPLQADIDEPDLTQILASTLSVDGNTSFGSTMTVPGSEKDLKPDFSFMHLTSVPLGEYRANSTYAMNRAGHKILHECHFVLCEVKGAPSRQLSEPRKSRIRAKLFQEAQADLAMYANMYFLAEGGMQRDKLLLWACVGALWAWAFVSREEVPVWDWVTESFPPGTSTVMFRTRFSQTFELCTPESDQEINHLITHYFQPDQIHEGEGNDGDDVMSEEDMNEDMNEEDMNEEDMNEDMNEEDMNEENMNEDMSEEGD
ncbi:MAG: hypothetical protein NXY57DRAFT_349604 [Lentinula lateritia]|uniref:HNH nuclease domain-containing protein n=1 Tax=Lentinula lateritia TaxID=40482 RepID=A0ABQ8V5T3_9AGAR|nr:MAG: hypothetical protein NXY57DRAFT_349604 [Lentinula lateritia]KAJ4475878.1 hypothetical protein C8R41DRAFT_923583 [Lentinula lateritia]